MIKVLKADLDFALEVHLQIPEFDLYQTKEDWKNRIKDNKHIILVAFENNIPVGYLVAYENNANDLYLWLAGVIPKYRHQKIYTAIFEELEHYSKENHYESLSLKTANKFHNMLMFSIKNDFMVRKVTEEKNILDNEIYLEKQLKR